jgi:hypothetical protein
LSNYKSTGISLKRHSSLYLQGALQAKKSTTTASPKKKKKTAKSLVKVRVSDAQQEEQP